MPQERQRKGLAEEETPPPSAVQQRRGTRLRALRTALYERVNNGTATLDDYGALARVEEALESLNRTDRQRGDP